MTTTPSTPATGAPNPELLHCMLDWHAAVVRYGVESPTAFKHFERCAALAQSAAHQEDAKDAARYRYIRNKGTITVEFAAGVNEDDMPIAASFMQQVPTELDHAVDAAIAASGSKES